MISSSLLTHRKDPMIIYPRVCDRVRIMQNTRAPSVRNRTSGVLLGKQTVAIFTHCLLITLFLSNSQAGKTLDFKDNAPLFPVCWEPSLATCGKGGNSSGWAWGGLLVNFRACLIKCYNHMVRSDKTARPTEDPKRPGWMITFSLERYTDVWLLYELVLRESQSLSQEAVWIEHLVL